jgi:predicted nucleic acid-binding Zn ribbon protein
MVRKKLGYVHLQWTCPRCETINLGPNKFCNACGAPQPEDVKFEQRPEEVLIEDEAEIARAKVGPDIHCPYCGARNPGDAKFCGACGGDLTEAEVRETGRVVGAFRDEPAEEILCPACNTPNRATAQRCENCGASLVVTKPETPLKVPTGVKRPRRMSVIGILAIALIAIVAIVLVISGLRTEEVIGEVQNVNWTRTIPILALGPVDYEGWYDEIPEDAEIHGCDLEFHHTADEPSANAIEICGTPYTVDTGSGYGEVVQDCVYEIYEDWCTYTQIEWTTVDAVTVTGSNLDAYWPEVTLSEGQTEGEGEETYEVVFQTEDRSYTLATSDFNEFRQFQLNSRWVLNVNALNMLVSVEPAD